ncbi:hypothetical protein OUZ56_015614 [Daphnia magna]|uniref:Uncharacterized protein n=1 Tax=Daphnia magna TaxID=35525 RepID=A0ABR0ANA8_9CRUS|nr:hypothetical protein OUZ56_015614 [Daphnia magna]
MVLQSGLSAAAQLKALRMRCACEKHSEPAVCRCTRCVDPSDVNELPAEGKYIKECHEKR